MGPSFRTPSLLFPAPTLCSFILDKGVGTHSWHIILSEEWLACRGCCNAWQNMPRHGGKCTEVELRWLVVGRVLIL